MLGQALGAAAAGIALPGCPNSRSGPVVIKKQGVSPNEQIGVGIIGCGRRNSQLQTGLGAQGAPPADARIVAVSDYNLTRAKQWGKHYKAEAYQDYRKML